MIQILPTCLTTEELVRYAQLQIDNGTPLPAPWAQELIKRLIAAIDDQK